MQTHRSTRFPPAMLSAALLALGVVACQDAPLSPNDSRAPGTPSFAVRGNSEAAHGCQRGGYLHLSRADGTRFTNAGECTSYAAQGGAFGPPPPPALSIDSVHLSSSVLLIDGPSVTYTAFITNYGSSTVSNIALQTWIDQGTASRAAGGLLADCTSTPGDVPPGTCSVSFTLSASNSSSTAGTGTLVPGAATARFELNQGGPAFDVFTLSVTLVGSGVSVDSVHLSSSTLTIDGPAVAYTAFITNYGSSTVSNIALQTWIDQGSASRAAGGLLANCTSTLGDVPPGTCAVTFGLVASNSDAGTGTLVPGAATARFELNQGGPAFGALTLPVTLVQ